MSQNQDNSALPQMRTLKTAKRSNRGLFIVLALSLLIAAGAGYFFVNRVLAQHPKKPAAPLPVLAPVDPLKPRLDALADRLTQVDQQVRALVDGQRQIQGVLSSIQAKLDKPAPVVQAAAVPAAPRRSVRRPQPVPKPQPVNTTELLSVDLWDNQPSIVLREADGSVHFARDGERTERGRYLAGRDGAQSVRLEHGDGSVSVMRAVGDH